MMNTWNVNKMFDLEEKYDEYLGLEQKVERWGKSTTNTWK